MEKTMRVIPMKWNRYNDGFDTEHVIRIPYQYRGTTLYHRFAIGSVPRGFEALKVSGMPKVPGPWAYTYGLCTVIDNHGGTGKEMRDNEAKGLEHDVKHGDILSIDAVRYSVRIVRGEYIELDPVTEGN